MEDRRLRGDLIQVFKLVKGFDIVAPNTFFNVSTTGLRGHTFKLYKSGFSTNIGKFSFSNRIIEHWNCLPQHVVSSDTVNTYKNRSDHNSLQCSGLNKSHRLSSLCRPFNVLNGFALNYVKLTC